VAIYAIGDLQGCYEPFRRLLDALEFEPRRDTLWLAGDLVNRGPKSLKTLRFVKELGDSANVVLGNHDLHLLALHAGAVNTSERFSALNKLLSAPDADELCDWLRQQPLARYDNDMDTLMVHAGVHADWSVKKTLKLASEVEKVLRGEEYEKLLFKMYGNTPTKWKNDLSGYKRLRFIINCLTRMRMLTAQNRLSFAYSGPPWRARKNMRAWYGGRELTAVRLDRRIPRVVQVTGQTA